MHKLLSFGMVLSAAITLASPGISQDYPNRTVKIIMPFAAGGTADAVPRIISEWLSRKWGQAVIVENRAGASGNIGAEAFAKSDPDGYTLMSTPPPPLVINQNLFPKLAFDPTEFAPIIILARVPTSLVINPQKVPAKDVAGLIAYAKANPGKLSTATTGSGGTPHLTSEMFQIMAAVKVQHVPYRGSAPALQDLVGGNIDLMFDNLGSSLALVNAGRIKLLAVGTPRRMAALPDVPTIAETIPGFESAAWYGLVAPAKTPQAIVNKINADINEALAVPAIRQRLEGLSSEAVGGTPQATAAYLGEETERWKNVIKTGGVKLD